MMLLHGSDGSGAVPCSETSCEHDLQQYLAMEALYNQSKIKAIGVSNYCASCTALSHRHFGNARESG